MDNLKDTMLWDNIEIVLDLSLLPVFCHLVARVVIPPWSTLGLGDNIIPERGNSADTNHNIRNTEEAVLRPQYSPRLSY